MYQESIYLPKPNAQALAIHEIIQDSADSLQEKVMRIAHILSKSKCTPLRQAASEMLVAGRVGELNAQTVRLIARRYTPILRTSSATRSLGVALLRLQDVCSNPLQAAIYWNRDLNATFV